MIVLMPLFILAIVLEIYLSRSLKAPIYDATESISHLFTWIGQQVANLFWFSVLLVLYETVLRSWGWRVWPSNSVMTWTSLALLTDFCWYWGHRCSHRINILWASHETHHQAHDFNLVSALRQSWTSRLFLFFFFLPLAVFGFSATDVLLAQGINSALQFFTHSGVSTAKWRWLDLIFVTPRMHRVHHGANEPYIDKNFGGVLSIWDRLFGTYQDMLVSTPICIGPPTDCHYVDALDANLVTYRKLFWLSRHIPSVKEKLLIWLRSPEVLERRLLEFGFRHEAGARPSRASMGPLFFVLLAFQLVLVFALMIRWRVFSLEARTLLGGTIMVLVVFTSRLMTEKRRISRAI